MSDVNTHGSGTKLLVRLRAVWHCDYEESRSLGSARGRGQHQKQLNYILWRQVTLQKEEIHAPILTQGNKNLKKRKNV